LIVFDAGGDVEFKNARYRIEMNNLTASIEVSKGTCAPRDGELKQNLSRLGFAPGIIRPSNFNTLRF